EDDDAKDAPEIGPHQLEAPAERLARALALNHDRGNDHGPTGQEQETRDDEQEEPDADTDHGDQPDYYHRGQVRPGGLERLPDREIRATVAYVLDRLHERGLQPEEPHERDQRREDRADPRQERHEHHADERDRE